jgi:hypothetical protein
MQGSVDVKGRKSSHAARHRAAGGTGVLDGVAWQPLGIGCPTWNGEGRTADAAWRWEEGWGDAWKGGAELQGGAPGRVGAAACSRGEAEGIGTGEDEGDPVVKSRKLRDLTVMHI